MEFLPNTTYKMKERESLYIGLTSTLFHNRTIFSLFLFYKENIMKYYKYYNKNLSGRIRTKRRIQNIKYKLLVEFDATCHLPHPSNSCKVHAMCHLSPPFARVLSKSNHLK